MRRGLDSVSRSLGPASGIALCDRISLLLFLSSVSLSESNGPLDIDFPTSLGYDKDKMRQWTQNNSTSGVISLG